MNPQGPPGNVFMTHQTHAFHDPNAPHGSLGATPIEYGRPSPYGYRSAPAGRHQSGTMPGRAMGAMNVSPGATAWAAVSTASMAVSAFHGYKRNESVGWALWWGFAGALFPVITPVIAVAQGYGDRKRG